MPRKKVENKVYFADFETTRPNEDNQVKVYLWACVRDSEVYTGDKLETFIEFMKSQTKAIFYFHNLKFDFSYIHYYLIENNIEYELLEKKGVYYQIKFFNVELRDSVNFLPMRLKEVGENYCAKFKKTSIDYGVDYNHKATPKEVEYCINDCRVLEEGLTNYLNSLDEILQEANCFTTSSKIKHKLTNAGIAFQALKELSAFEKCCPKTTKNEYELFKKAYHGGFVYSKPCGIQEDVLMIDCNSMYPYIYSSYPLPIGKPHPLKNYEDSYRFDFSIFAFKVKYELKDGYIPIIGGGLGKIGNTEYKSTSFGEWEDLIVCNIDFLTILEYYDIEYKFIWGVGFKSVPNFFKTYAETFIEVKNREKGVKRNVAKVLLNSPYGKLAMNGLNEIVEYTIDEYTHKIVRSVKGFDLQEEAFQYLPMAIAITAHARNYLLRTAQAVGLQNVLYMDTDSIKFKFNGYPETVKIDPNILGAWKDEGMCELFKTISPKRYGYYLDGKIHFTVAGIPDEALTERLKDGQEVNKFEAFELLNEFNKGLEFECLQLSTATGGKVLNNIKKVIK